MIKVSSETSVASGIRRIESFTGKQAIAFCDQQEDTVAEIAAIIKGGKVALTDKILALVDENRKLHRDIEKLKDKLASASGQDLMANIREINGISVLAVSVDGTDAKGLRGIADQVRSQIKSGVFFLVSIDGSKASLIAGVTQDLTNQFKAGELLKHITDEIGGKGGGRADMAQGASSSVDRIPVALELVYGWVNG